LKRCETPFYIVVRCETRHVLQFLNHTQQLLFGMKAGLFVFYFSVFKDHQGGNATNLVAIGQFLILINVDLDDPDALTQFTGNLLEYGRLHFAWLAPQSMEIDNNRLRIIDDGVKVCFHDF